MKIKYKSEDVTFDGYWELFEGTGWNKGYQISRDELYLAFLNSWFKVGAYDGEKLIGFGRVVTDGILHAMIYDLITDLKYQGLGVGTEILQRLIQKCQSSGIRDIQLFCAKRKRKFYEKRGFVARHEESPGMEYKNSQ